MTFPTRNESVALRSKHFNKTPETPLSADEAVSKHIGGCSPCYRVYSRLLRKEIARMPGNPPTNPTEPKKRPRRLRNNWTDFAEKTPLCK